MGLEDKTFQKWKKWAEGEVLIARQMATAVYSGPEIEEGQEQPQTEQQDEPMDELEAASREQAAAAEELKVPV